MMQICQLYYYTSKARVCLTREQVCQTNLTASVVVYIRRSPQNHIINRLNMCLSQQKIIFFSLRLIWTYKLVRNYFTWPKVSFSKKK